MWWYILAGAAGMLALILAIGFIIIQWGNIYLGSDEDQGENHAND